MLLMTVRMFLNGVSLVLQNAYPDRGVTANYGHEQLFFRSIIRFSGIPLYFAMTLQAMADLHGTPRAREPLELVVHTIRAFVIIPMLSAALAHQWRYSGVGTEPRCNPVNKTASMGSTGSLNGQTTPTDAHALLPVAETAQAGTNNSAANSSTNSTNISNNAPPSTNPTPSLLGDAQGQDGKTETTAMLVGKKTEDTEGMVTSM